MTNGKFECSVDERVVLTIALQEFVKSRKESHPFQKLAKSLIERIEKA